MRPSEHHFGFLNELCSLLFSALRSPLFSIPFAPYPAAAWARLPPMSPVGMVSLFLGISLALMLCGSVTFVIGFMMMPWVLGMVMLLYFFGIISCISGFCKAALISHTASPSPRKTCPNESNGHTAS